MENSPEKEMLEEIRNTYLDTFPNVIFRMTERLMEKDKELADIRAENERLKARVAALVGLLRTIQQAAAMAGNPAAALIERDLKEALTAR